MGGNNENARVASPESVPIHLNKNYICYIRKVKKIPLDGRTASRTAAMDTFR